MTADPVRILEAINAAERAELDARKDLLVCARRLAAAERALGLMLAPWELGRMEEVDVAIAAWRETQNLNFSEPAKEDK